MCVLIIARVGAAVFKVIIMTVIRIVVKRLMTINVAIVSIMMNAAATVVMLAIVITITLKRMSTVVVIARIVDIAIIGVMFIIIITRIILIMSVVSMTATLVCVSVVN